MVHTARWLNGLNAGLGHLGFVSHDRLVVFPIIFLTWVMVWFGLAHKSTWFIFRHQIYLVLFRKTWFG